MLTPKLIAQDPTDVLDYTINWADAQNPALSPGESIQTSTFIADSSDYTISNESFTATLTVFFLTGGIIGKTYYIENVITTSSSRTTTTVIPYIPTQRLTTG